MPSKPLGSHKKRGRLSAGETQDSRRHRGKPPKCASRSELYSVAETFKCILKYQESLADILRGCMCVVPASRGWFNLRTSLCWLGKHLMGEPGTRSTAQHHHANTD